MSSAVPVGAAWAIGLVLSARVIAVCFVDSSTVSCVVAAIEASMVTARFLMVGCVVAVMANSMVTVRVLIPFVALTPAVRSSMIGCVVAVVEDSMVTVRFFISFVALTPANMSAMVACIFIAYTVVSAPAVLVLVFCRVHHRERVFEICLHHHRVHC